jgi:sodium transport system permease protein
MNFRNIRLIYAREIRDQLRDRRTLFMIAVLPLLLYPLLGMSVFQLSQFVRKSEPKILVIGRENLRADDGLPPLLEGDQFSPKLTGDPKVSDWLHLEFAATPGATSAAAEPLAPDAEAAEGETPSFTTRELRLAEARLKSGDVQVVLNFPPDFGERLQELRDQIEAGSHRDSKPADGTKDAKTDAPILIPQPQLLFNSGKEKSRVAHSQVEQILDAWKSQIVRDNLLASRVPANVARPFELKPHDVAERRQQQALMWSKILPFVLFIWALTGAFYPAVDLCAGEKERGTLETLLSSPATRMEIVWGKLLTVMTFSCATAVLNLASIGITSRYVIAQLSSMPLGEMSQGLELPPFTSLLWLLVALVPMSALFSALCLACAAFARSTKEGQYYLMPLFMISMPLMMLPLAPGSDLNLGNSLIPITGVILLVMSLVQGEYAAVLPYIIPVCGITAICCHWAIRWAVYQFNQESVLFRESERLDPRRWLVHLVRDRRDTPSLAEGFVCVVLIFVIRFFMELALAANVPANPNFKYFTLLLFISQVVCIALPALLMALILTGRPAKTLLLTRRPTATVCAMAIALAALLHPFGMQLSAWIRELYPMQDATKDTLELMNRMLSTAPNAWLPIALLALVPAVCEELAFRGFVLSGLRHVGSKWWAIGLTAVFFGVVHGFVQQSISAAFLGVVLGYIAVQTGTIIPCMLFHATYNALGFVAAAYLPQFTETRPLLWRFIHEPAAGQILYSWHIVAITLLAAAILLLWFRRLPYQATREEQITDARSRQPHHPLPAAAQSTAE